MQKKLKFTYLKWLTSYGELQVAEKDVLDFYRTTYKSKIPKKELELHLSSLESWVKFAYETKRLFHVTGLLKDNDQPYVALLLNDGNAIVEFIDEFNRIYLRYFFSSRFNKPEFVFLTSLNYFIYPDNNFYASFQRKSSVTYDFTPEGGLTVTKSVSNGDGTNNVTVEEATTPIDVSKNWEPYPKLGEYESIVRLKRWDDGDFLKNPPLPDFLKN
jgi:hypothetical protein